MKVSSPVGDFPFVARSLTVEHGTLVVEGSMGAWPARVQVAREDVPALVRLVPTSWLAVIGSLSVLVLVRLAWGVLRPGRA